MFLLANDDPGGAPIAGDGTSICMSALPLEDELLIERNDAVRLHLPKYLLIFLENKENPSYLCMKRKVG